MGNTDCSQIPPLDWDGPILVGSSKDEAVIGKIDGETIVIKCSDPEFDKLVGTTRFAELQEAEGERLKKCLKWEE